MRNSLPTRLRGIRILACRTTLVCSLVTVVISGTFLTGCASIIRPVRKTAHLSGQLTLYVTVNPDANNDAPIAVDVVAVDDPKLLAEVSALTADVWFSKRRDIDKLHPGVLHVHSWEWVPGEQVPTAIVPATAVAAGVLLFAHYSTPGSHAAALPQSGEVRISFVAADFALIPPPK